MAQPVARIRPFQSSDDRVVRFAIGKANMESLAVANSRGKSGLLVRTYLKSIFQVIPTRSQLLSSPCYPTRSYVSWICGLQAPSASLAIFNPSP
jgi:hypothetical protein